MRSTYVALVAAAFMIGCADAPSAPSLEPGAANLFLGKAPPPWALIEGEVTTSGDGSLQSRVSFSIAGDGGALMSHGDDVATYRAWLLVTPGNQVKLLRFTEGGSATFSNGAMLSNVNGKISGRGTMTVDGHTYQLSAVTEFEANGECAATAWDYDGPICAEFSAGDGSFSSEASVWTGTLSSDGGGKGWDSCDTFDCVCVNCEVSVTGGKGGRR